MNTRRDELLRATEEAARVLHQFPVERRTSFDIVGAVLALGVPLVFRPLKGLWGAAISVGSERRGVIVTTKLGLHIQRFTLAHELGHVLLGHGTSLDEIVNFQGRLVRGTRPIHELAADLFASELLAARSLMLNAARRHKWDRTAFADPTNVYQLSLRLGLSFEATCWALAAQRVIPQQLAKSHQDGNVKDIKLAISSDVEVTNSWADVWMLTQADSDSFLEAGPDDLFAIYLQENVSAGFLWELIDCGPFGKVVEERRSVSSLYGDPASRVVYIRFGTPGNHQLVFEHRRPWNRQTIAHIDVAIANHGKEEGGFARRLRETRLAAASA